MANLSITPDQLTAAGNYIIRNWGDTGYRVEAIESPTRRVTVFRVVASDGSRFSVLADKWGNSRDLDTHHGDAGLSALVSAMHENSGGI